MISAREGKKLDSRERTETKFYAVAGIMVEPFVGQGIGSESNAGEDPMTGDKANLESVLRLDLSPRYDTKKISNCG